MNKELILKYKTEFDHWLNGGKLRHKAYGKWEQTNNIWSCRTADIAAVIIDDEYVEFRKALAEGKTIQHISATTGEWVDFNKGFKLTPSYTFLATPEYYRIKSDRHKFKGQK